MSYFIERSGQSRLRFLDWIEGEEVWRIGQFRAFDDSDEVQRIADRLVMAGYSVTVRHCPNPLTVNPGTRTLTAESAKRAREFFTAAHPDLPIKLSNDAAVAMLATVFPVLIDGTLHYSGSFQFPEAINHPANQGVLFDA